MAFTPGRRHQGGIRMSRQRHSRTVWFASLVVPALLLAGVAIGLCAPSVQIGALSGVTDAATGLAAGLVETMREIGGAAGVAAVSTVLVSQAGVDGFHAAFLVICIAGALGALTATVAFERRARSATDEPVVVPEAPTSADALVPVPVPVDDGPDPVPRP